MMPLFEKDGVKQVIPGLALRIIDSVSTQLGKDPEIVVFPSEMPSPWVCFNVGERKFGIWKMTLTLYEADEHGAMGEDPIDPASVKA